MHSKWPKLYRILAILSAIGLNCDLGPIVQNFKTSVFIKSITCKSTIFLLEKSKLSQCKGFSQFSCKKNIYITAIKYF